MREDSIEQIVRLQLQCFSELLTNDEGTFVDILAKKTNKDTALWDMLKCPLHAHSLSL